MSRSLSSLADNLAKGLHKDKCKMYSVLEYMTVNDDPLVFKCVDCNKNYEKRFNKDLVKRFDTSQIL